MKKERYGGFYSSYKIHMSKFFLQNKPEGSAQLFLMERVTRFERFVSEFWLSQY